MNAFNTYLKYNYLIHKLIVGFIKKYSFVVLCSLLESGSGAAVERKLFLGRFACASPRV